MPTGSFSKKNIDHINRNGRYQSGIVIKYITQGVIGQDGIDGENGLSVYLSSTSHTFEGDAERAIQGQTYHVDVFAFSGSQKLDIFIDTSTGLTGLIENGLDASINDNGTKITSLDFNVGSELTTDAGDVIIPLFVYTQSNPDSSIGISNEWYEASEYIIPFNLSFSWNVSKSGAKLYTLDLTNDAAHINVDASGNVLPGAIMPTSKATLYFGTEEVENATYVLVTVPEQNVTGISIDASGNFTFDASTIAFEGTSTEVTVYGRIGVQTYGVKVMTVIKAYPSANGEPAVSYWMNLTANAIRVNPNVSSVVGDPSTISVTKYKQVGSQAPVTADEAVIKYGYDTSTPTITYSGTVTVDISKSYLSFGMYVDDVLVDGIETVPILRDGTNGLGSYRLDLTNENAGINCDSSGNILSGAIRPTCKATLFFGTDEVDNAEYSITTTATGVSIDASTGELTFGSNFSFTGTSTEVLVSAKVGSLVCGNAVMTISKNYPGPKGETGTTYFLSLSADAIKVNPNASTLTATPATITAVGYKQLGENDPVEATECVIKYAYNSQTPNITYTSAISVDPSKTYISFAMYLNDKLVDGIETVPILRDGENGNDGYRLDLTNENAGINADASGNILSGAIRPTCTATLYIGTQVVSNAVYSISTTATGVSISSSTGELTFASNFNFSGTSVEITVSAKVSGSTKGTAIMTVSKNMAGGKGDPGKDGTTYWLNLSANAIKVNPNSGLSTGDPSTITASAMKQVGADTPVSASECTIKYGYNTQTPTSTYSSAITVDITKNYISFGLYLGNTLVDGVETVPILRDGVNGIGSYRLDLTNENAGINCDASGNILSGATRPTCTATLFYGSNVVEGVSYAVSTSATGVSINSSSGVLTFSSNFNFSGTSVEVLVTASVNSTVLGSSIMTISKNYPGPKGESGTTYWLTLSADAVYVDVNNSNAISPSSITPYAMKQVGEGEITTATECTIYYSYNTTPTTSSNTITSGHALNVSVTNNYELYFALYKDGVQVDIETVLLLRNGANGQRGPEGPRGYNGCIYRRSVWASGKVYRNDVALTTDGEKYIDLCFNKDQTLITDTSLKLYECITTHTSNSNSIPLGASGYWNEISISSTTPTYFPLIFATQISADLIDVSQIKVTDLADISNLVVQNVYSKNGSFSFDASGNMIALSGTFAGYVRMPYTFISDLDHTSNGYTADYRTYLIADEYSGSYGMGDGGMLILPEPSSSNNGLTYHIIAKPNVATKAAGQNPAISVRSANSSACFEIYAYPNSITAGSAYKRLSFFGGHAELTCAPYHNNYGNTAGYHWLLTMCTGGVNVYTSTSSSGFAGSFSTVHGYSPTDFYYAVTTIQTDNIPASNKKRDVMYISV